MELDNYTCNAVAETYFLNTSIRGTEGQRAYICNIIYSLTAQNKLVLPRFVQLYQIKIEGLL